MRKVGLYLINVNIADITDESDYIESIGKKAASTAVEQARVDVANAERDGAIGKAEADRTREIQVAQNNAEAEKEGRRRRPISVSTSNNRKQWQLAVRTLLRQRSPEQTPTSLGRGIGQAESRRGYSSSRGRDC